MCVRARVLGHSVVSNSFWPHGLYSPWNSCVCVCVCVCVCMRAYVCLVTQLYPNSPGQSTRVGSLPLLQGIFATQGLNPGSIRHIAGGFFTIWATREATRFLTKVESAMKSVFLNNDVSWWLKKNSLNINLAIWTMTGNIGIYYLEVFSPSLST